MGGGDAHAIAPIQNLVFIARNFKALAHFLVSHDGDISQAFLACVDINHHLLLM